MSSNDIYSLTSEYKQVVASESNASLRSCEILYQIQSTLLKQHDNNPNNSKYKKEIAKIRQDIGVTRTQMMKDIAVGKALIQVYASSNEIREMNKTAIYKQYCAPPKTPKPPKEKINWQQKYEQLQAEYAKQAAALLRKYEATKEELDRLKSGLN